MHYPIELGNIVLIVVGIALVISGPVIVYRTLAGIRNAPDQTPLTKQAKLNNTINFLIAALFFLAGICFIINNFRGNPLS